MAWQKRLAIRLTMLTAVLAGIGGWGSHRNASAYAREARAPLVISAQGLGPIRLGISRREAERLLHAKLDVDRSQQPDGDCSVAGRADGRDDKISYLLIGRVIRRIDVWAKTDTAIATSKGISVGSTFAALRARYGKHLVRLPSPTSEPDIKVLRVERAPGGGQLIAEVENGVVRTLSAGLAPEIRYEEQCG